ncbi:MAG: trypsin-like peptidase domain-containing protein [Pirellulales bacterium]
MRRSPACSSLRVSRPVSRLLSALVVFVALAAVATALASELRKTPIVKAFESAKHSVVNIHGQKTVTAADDAAARSDGPRRVNGMGTGVVIDERGYILTNYHVVEGVKRIEVTLADNTTHVAQLVSSDPAQDLAVIRVNLNYTLPVVTIGTSSDLMIGEPVIALGNAYGYSHTLTRGIVSSLHRSVQVSDAQSYEDLIQTDASINPGNSGGPLLNIDGEMVGMNVAVRAQAQGIGFAIPIDKAISIAADLMSVSRLEGRWHGIVAKPAEDQGHGLIVQSVQKNSPAERAGIKSGDVIKRVADQEIRRALDLERALLGRNADEELALSVDREQESLQVALQLARRPRGETTPGDQIWTVLGLRLSTIPAEQFKAYNNRVYRGGLAVLAVRTGSPAERQGIQRGDVLLGMHEWETVTPENVDYILNRPDFSQFEPLKFYILRASNRGSEVLYGHMAVAGQRPIRQ